MSDKHMTSIPPAPKMPDAPKTGNVQVEGSAVHTNPTAEKKAILQAQIDELNRLEAKTVPGAPVRTPKEQLLNTDALQAKNPDKHYRFINTTDPGKVATRIINDKYERLSEADGGRSLGELTLFEQPRSEYDARKKREAELTRQREHAHVHEVEQAVEGVARFLRDRYGIRVDPNRMIVKE